ncbi:MAG: TatD family hydrolase [Bacteroidota bacterium]
MEIIDTHAHLFLDAFKDDRDQVITNAFNIGVTKIFLPNIDSSTIAPMNNLCKLYPGKCYSMIGLHPTSVKSDYKSEFKIIQDEIQKNHRQYIAIGEIGIDLYWDKTYVNEQKEIFNNQLELAQLFNLPVSIHTRNSFNEALEVIDKLTGDFPKGVFHCFSGNSDQAEKAIKRGFKLGIGGVVTFKNSNLTEIIQRTDLKDIVLETDSPYLTPDPFRGKRNECSYIKFVLEKIAEIKNLSVSEVAKITTKNVYDIFDII